MGNNAQERYQVIARKYRPKRFSEVFGQEAVVTTLKNAIRFEKVANGYLFTGSRGVGKTTLARIFSKALNCSELKDFEPCNECPSCREINAGQSLDVIEIDGASNRGIDDIRRINETIGYAPTHGKYKIYLIDEVHMLTKEAFNALLKTLEEPPARAKFFFATTEPHKVLPTIISRCQRFDLARIHPKLIAEKLEQIARDMNRSIEKSAVELIAQFAQGSLRDAESLLDQLLCFKEEVTVEAVRQTLGLVSEEIFQKLDRAFSESALLVVFELVDHLFHSGKDLLHFYEQLVEHFRRVVVKAGTGVYTQEQGLYILDLLIQREASFQKSIFPRIALESVLLQIVRSKHRVPVDVLVKRLVDLEKNLEGKGEAVREKEVVKEDTKIDLQDVKELKPVPFNPFKEIVAPTAPVIAPIIAPVSEKHPSHYDTIMRFAAVELEGTVKK